MTPAARLSAAIAVLDRILAGEAAEQALTNWGRASRFAGSGDRHAVRDLVYDALRCKSSFAALGGGMTGRGLILGGVRASGRDPAEVFTGQAHAPPPLCDTDAGHVPDGAAALDVPEWILSCLSRALGGDTRATLQAMQRRAPVYLRVNPSKGSLSNAATTLADDGIATKPVPGLEFGLEVLENARKISQSLAYTSGMVELQDASSQAVVEALPLADGMRVLDFCAGGGGKTLAMAARSRLHLFAHDAEPARMRDLPPRALRAGTKVEFLKKSETSAPYDLILTDVPCSGSGSWRRDPMGKWSLSPERLALLCKTQAEILARTAPMVAASGYLAYVTCSLLCEENEDQVKAFLEAREDWVCPTMKRFSPLQGGDGFFLALLKRRD